MFDVLVFYLRGQSAGQVIHVEDQEVIHSVMDEMIERGILSPDHDTPFKPFHTVHEVEPIRTHVREGLAAATELARRKNAAVVIMDLKGLGRCDPFIDQLAKSGVPLIFPQVPTYQQGSPLTRDGIRELRAWNDAQKSRMIAEAARRRGDTAGGGDMGRRPSPEEAEHARSALQVAADEAAEERKEPVVEAYVEAGSYTGAAKLLNERKVTTPSGAGTWHPQIVKRVLTRLGVVV